MAETIIEFGAEISIRTVRDFFTKLQQHLNNGDSLTLDATNLTYVDTAGAQLLFWLAQAARHSTHQLSWQQNGTAELKAQLQHLGIHIPELFPTFD